jgi:XkdW protein
MHIGDALEKMFPGARQPFDYAVEQVDGGYQIVSWNMDEPQPSEEEIQAVLDELEANPPAEPLSPYDELKKQHVDLVFELLMKGVI